MKKYYAIITSIAISFVVHMVVLVSTTELFPHKQFKKKSAPLTFEVNLTGPKKLISTKAVENLTTQPILLVKQKKQRLPIKKNILIKEDTLNKTTIKDVAPTPDLVTGIALPQKVETIFKVERKSAFRQQTVSMQSYYQKMNQEQQLQIQLQQLNFQLSQISKLLGVPNSSTNEKCWIHEADLIKCETEKTDNLLAQYKPAIFDSLKKLAQLGYPTTGIFISYQETHHAISILMASP